MNILFPTISKLNDINGDGIYMDLLHEFCNHGHNVYIVSPIERKSKEKEQLIVGNHLHILRVKILNIQKTNVIEKGLSTITIEFLYLRAMKKHFNGIKFDLILFPTPPITFSGLVARIKKRDKAKTYLLLKDIFPQNAVDLGMFKKDSLFYKYFRKKEKELYCIADNIGCMSPANVKFVIEQNRDIDPKKVEVNPNSVKLSLESYMESSGIREKDAIRMKYGIPLDKTVFVYGGNLGKPQGLDFLPIVLGNNEKRKNAFFLIVGNGTEYNKIKVWFDDIHPKNAMLLHRLSKHDYDKLISSCDVGLIFLDHRFTIPNYPSRLLGYLQNKMPIICATDNNTDMGPIAVKNGYGLWCKNGNIDEFDSIVDKINNPRKIKEMGENGYMFLCENYTVEKSYATIMKHFS